MDEQMKICFISLGAYSLLTGRDSSRIIGPDVHQVTLAKELTKYENLRMIFIIDDAHANSYECVDGIDIINIYEPFYEPKILSSFSKIVTIWKSMKKADADIYIHRGGLAGIPSFSCKMLNRMYIYQIASDALVDKSLIRKNTKGFNRSKFSVSSFGNWLDIKLADSVVVQGEYQRKMLKQNFRKTGVIIKKPILMSDSSENFGSALKIEPPIVLWVGSMAEVKQPDLFIELAKEIPTTKFQMIGGYSSANKELYTKICMEAKKIPNVEFLGSVPFHKIDRYFQQSSILVNTSMFEGFPTYSIIQAWMNNTPVISLNDNSDKVITNYRLGLHSESFPQLVKDVIYLLNNDVIRKEMGLNGRKFVEKEHNSFEVVKRYISLFNELG